MPVSRPLLVLAVTGVLALSSCSSDPGGNDDRPTSWSLAYSAGGPAISLAAQVEDVAVAGDLAVFAFSDTPGGAPDKLGSVDLPTGKRVTLATASFPGGAITGAVQLDDEIVYVEESDRGDVDPGSARWRVVTLGSQEVLATSGSRSDTMTPDLHAVDGSAVWVVYPDAGGARPKAFGWKPGGEVEPQQSLPGEAEDCTPPSTASDDRITSCVHEGDWVAWVETATADGPTEPEHPAVLYVAPAAGGPGRRVAELHDDSSGSLVVLGDYLLWTDERGIAAESLRHPSATTRIPGTSGAFLEATGEGRATVLLDRAGTSTLRVVSQDDLTVTSD